MSETDVAVIMAKAMFPSDYPSRVIQEAVRGMAADAITALEANGWAIVPCEPSEAMWDAAMREGYDQDPATYYRAMISTGKAKA